MSISPAVLEMYKALPFAKLLAYDAALKNPLINTPLLAALLPKAIPTKEYAPLAVSSASAAAQAPSVPR